MKWENANAPDEFSREREQLQNAACATHFPTRFVTPAFLRVFVSRHGLVELQGAQKAACHRDYASSMGSLNRLRGVTHNLTAAQVWARIVAPALEATGGMSYAEAFLSQVRFHRCMGALPVGGCAVAFSVALALSLVFNRRE